MPIFPIFFFAIQARNMSFTIFQSEKTPFQAIKTKSLKSRKIDIFPKGLTHGFGPKMAIFPTCFFQAIQARKMSFTIFWSEKTSFQALKTRSSKSRKIEIFPKGLTNFFFQATQARKMSFTIFQSEKTSFYAKKTRSLKSPKIDIFPKELTHAFGPNMVVFPTFFFLAIQARKMSFTIFQSEKTPLQAIRTKSSESQKIDIFPKGLTHCFGPKMVIFPTLFLENIGQENVFYDILDRKNDFLSYKNKKFNKSKN